MSIRSDLYESAINWVAVNGDQEDLELEPLAGQSVLIAMISDVFDMDARKVNLDVKIDRAAFTRKGRK